MCSNACKCFGCKNFEESPERRTLMHLADAAEVRVQQQTAAKTKLSSQISGIPSKPPASTPSGERFVQLWQNMHLYVIVECNFKCLCPIKKIIMMKEFNLLTWKFYKQKNGWFGLLVYGV